MKKFFAISLVNPWVDEKWVNDIFETISQKPLKRLKSFVVMDTSREVIAQQYSHLLNIPQENRAFFEPYLDLISGEKTYLSIHAGYSREESDFYKLVSQRRDTLRKKYDPLIKINKPHPEIKLHVLHASDSYKGALRDLQAWQTFVRARFGFSLMDLLKDSNVSLPKELFNQQ